MTYQKNFIKIICLSFLIVYSGDLHAGNPELYTESIEMKNSHQMYLNSCSDVKEINLLVDCTIRIKNDNGTDLKITFHDISLFECAKIKIGKWLKDIF